MKTSKLIVFLILFALAVTGCTEGEDTAETEAATEALTESTEAVTEAAVTEVDIEKGAVDIDALLAEGKPILLQFSQEGCPPCEQMQPLIKQVQDEYEDTVIVRYVDVHQNLQLATDYRVRMTPTQVFIDADGNFYEPENLTGIEFVDLEDGTRMVRHVGLIPEDLLRTYLDDLAVQ